MRHRTPGCAQEGARAGRLAPAHQGLGIAARRIEHVEIIEREVAAPVRNQALGERALAGLARAGHDHGGHHREVRAERLTDSTRKGLHGVNDIHSRHE
ncbi:MAG: hypothetical protein HY719_00545 [Planctomycetes bacterium]|nr:hypothetical protein [Planctomycetota bacterium]